MKGLAEDFNASKAVSLGSRQLPNCCRICAGACSSSEDVWSWSSGYDSG